MSILALDTSGPVCSVAVIRDGLITYEARAINRLTHSRNLLPMIDEALHKSGSSREDLQFIAAVVGPGSFTGVRIGVATAQGMARGLNISCIAVNALEAMARSVSFSEHIICPIRDARSQQVYGAAFQNGNRLMPDSAMKLDDFLKAIDAFGETFYFLGDGAAVMGESIKARLGDRAVIAPRALIQPGVAAAAVLAEENADKAVPPSELMPLYLRAPQAERLLAKKNQNA
ncbi:MAG: tRNA (adenosine(37)-N6)-threonylcarbamoyltransferase complex dimerization subunit type 1 TsaB [Bacillota bacterium]|nr:tRNA (adenosine(37)-N6)-threonylcarbamoyltransferase complex dimerization subunit type 1 TsaB [Bacillota bacterium]